MRNFSPRPLISFFKISIRTARRKKTTRFWVRDKHLRAAVCVTEAQAGLPVLITPLPLSSRARIRPSTIRSLRRQLRPAVFSLILQKCNFNEPAFIT
jgi:hypothetical protein